MKELSSLIKNLTKEETRNFKIFTSRIDTGEDKKIVQLFDYLKDEKYDEDSEELSNLLFPKGDKNPFYRLKNRLFDDIEKSLLLLHSLNTDKNTILSFITLANNFEKRNNYDLSYFYLKKAEKKANSNKYYDLLFIIYGAILNLSSFYDEINPELYNKLYIENLEKYKLSTEAVNSALLINHKLKKTNFSTKDVPESILNDIISELNISNSVYQLDSVRISNHECIRDVLLLRKNFKQLEEYMIRSLTEFEKDKVFNEENYKSKLSMLVWIVNALNKNKKFNQSAIYNEILFQEMVKYDKRYYNEFIFSYYAGLMIDHIAKWNIDKAIELLEELKNNKQLDLNRHYSIYLHLNLISLYFIKSNTSMALKNLAFLMQKDNFKQQSTEMQMVVSIIDLIIQYETGDTEYLLSRIAYYERYFKEDFDAGKFEREHALISLIKYGITKEGGWKNKYTQNKTEEFLKMKPEFELGSNETIDYNLWIKSKSENTSYAEMYKTKAMS